MSRGWARGGCVSGLGGTEGLGPWSDVMKKLGLRERFWKGTYIFC